MDGSQMLSLQSLTFKRTINSELFVDEFKKLEKDEQLDLIRKLIGHTGFVSVTNIPQTWHENYKVAVNYVYSGTLPKEIYERWSAIWGLISRKSYAAEMKVVSLEHRGYISEVKIWGKKPPFDLPESAKIFKPDGRPFETCEYFFDDLSRANFDIDVIRVVTYDNPHPSGIFGVLIPREKTIDSWMKTNHMLMSVLYSNENTWILENNGYDVSSIPPLSEEYNRQLGQWLKSYPIE